MASSVGPQGQHHMETNVITSPYICVTIWSVDIVLKTGTDPKVALQTYSI